MLFQTCSFPKLDVRRDFFIKLLTMLRFLEERQSSINSKPAYKVKPYISFGVSIDSPTTFQNQYSMISPTSYVNPFVSLQNRSYGGTSTRRVYAPAHWTNKTDILQVEEGKVVGSGGPSSQPDRYHRSYYNQLKKNSSRFRLTKGEFSTEIEKIRIANEVFGPMAGQERSAKKSLQTKRSLMKQSYLHLEKSRDKLEMEKTLRKESSRILQKIIDEKRNLRHKRDDLQTSFRKQLTQRKKSKHDDYTLPRVLIHCQSKSKSKPQSFGLFRTLDNSTLNRFIK